MEEVHTGIIQWPKEKDKKNPKIEQYETIKKNLVN
jgi:hypothetical protein